MDVDIVIAEPVDGEKNFIRDSWRWSFQESPANAAMPSSAYGPWFSNIARKFLGEAERVVRLAPGCHLLVARDAKRPAVCYGWALFHVDGDALTLVYAFVKGGPAGWRRNRICGRLIAAAMEQHDIDPDKVFYGSRTRFDSVWERRGWTYRPFQSLLHRGAA